MVLLDANLEDAAEAVADAGLLAIVPAPRLDGEDALPAGDVDACEEIVRRLDLAHEGTIHLGEGI